MSCVQDYGFMSTTLDQAVALHYSKARESAAASTVLAIQMDESNRGALIAFLSYYRAIWPEHLDSPLDNDYFV